MLTGFDINYPRIILICIKGSGNFIGTGLISNTFQQSVSIICRNKSKGGRTHAQPHLALGMFQRQTRSICDELHTWHSSDIGPRTLDTPPQIRMSLWGSLCWNLSARSAFLTLQHGARHLLHSLSLGMWNIYPLESSGEVLRRQCGGSAVTALGEGGVEERTAEAFDHV